MSKVTLDEFVPPFSLCFLCRLEKFLKENLKCLKLDQGIKGTKLFIRKEKGGWTFYISLSTIKNDKDIIGSFILARDGLSPL